jgi:hypothetical protein
VTEAARAPGSLLRERLSGDPGAIPFAEAVFAQLVGPAGALAGAPPAARDVLEAHLADVLLASAGEDGTLAARLLAEPPLAAAFFQNLDLLYAHGSTHADAMSTLLMRVLELAAEEAPP